MKSELLFFSFSLIFLSWIALENLTLNQRAIHVYCYYNDCFDATLGEKNLFKLLKVIKYHLFNDQIKYHNQLDLFTFYFRSLNLPLVKSNFIRRCLNNYFAPKWNSQHIVLMYVFISFSSVNRNVIIINAVNYFDLT